MQQQFGRLKLVTVKEAVFESILNAEDGDYVILAQLLAAMKYGGW